MVIKIRPVTTADNKTSFECRVPETRAACGKKGNGDILSDTALGREILRICFFLKFGSSIRVKRAATLTGRSPCYGHVN